MYRFAHLLSFLLSSFFFLLRFWQTGVAIFLAAIIPASTQAQTGTVLTFDQVLKETINLIDGLSGVIAVTVSPDGKYVYAAGNTDDAVTLFARDSTSNTLRFVEVKKDNTTGVDGLNGASALLISPDGKHLYAASEFADAVAVFNRNTDSGTLDFSEFKKDGVSGIEGLDGAASLTISPDGKHLYVISQIDHSVAVFSRAPVNGELGFKEKHTDGQNGVDGLSGGLAIVISPDGQHVYAAGSNDDAIAVFSRNTTTGALTFVEVKVDGTGGVDGLNGVGSLAISPDGSHLYAGGSFDDKIAVFSRNSTTGALTFVEVKTDNNGGINGLDGISYLIVSTDGEQVYAAAINDISVAIFARNTTTGALVFNDVLIDGENDVNGLSGVSGLALSPNGRYLYAAAQFDNALTTLDRDTLTGELDYSQSRFEGDGEADGLSEAQDVAISPDGKHVYVANGSGIELSVFRRDDAQEKLLFVEVHSDNQNGVHGLLSTSSVTVSPDGKFVYTTGSIDDAVSVFSRNATTGVLTFVEAKFDGLAGINGLNGASFVLMSPDSAHVYVAGSDEDAIVVFSRNIVTGKITFVEYAQTGVGGVTLLDNPKGLAISPDGKYLYATSLNDDAVTVFSRDTPDDLAL